MAKYYQLRAPASISLQKMSEKEIDEMVKERADKALASLPDEFSLVGTQGIIMDSITPGTSAEAGVWAQWTRACCDKRKRIEDFVEPITEDMMNVAKSLRPQSFEHIESQLSIQTLSNPKMHARKTKK